MIDRSLIEAYRNTDFIIDAPDGQLVLHVGEPNQQIDALLRDRGFSECAYITASNPKSARLDSAENARRHAALVERVRKLGFPFLSGRGIGTRGDWLPEESLFIIGIGRASAHELGRDFGQNAIVFKAANQDPELLLCLTAVT